MLEKTSTNKDGRTQIFFTPFRPKSLDCWEYVSRRFETVNLPHVLRELDLGICFNMIIFDILSLSWKATEISSFRLSLEFCVISQHEQNHWGTLFSSGVSAISMAPIRFFRLLIILALSAGAADTNSTSIAGALQNMSTGKGISGQTKRGT